jgi:hypothetical protein
MRVRVILDGELSRLRASVVIAVALACLSAALRLALMRILPNGSWSSDLYTWRSIAQLLSQGVNPYDATNALNWPPLWMQTIFVLDHVSRSTHLSIIRVIQLFLISLEALVTIATYLLLSRHWHVRRAWLLVLAGLVLNPVAMILTVVHGNFDVIAGLAVVMFLWAITSWVRNRRPEDWLFACLFVGLGVLAKTTPLVLAPLLLVGWGSLNWRLGAVGAALVAGPAGLGLSVIYTLGPHQVVTNVVRYHSLAGFFGITGLVNALHWPVSSLIGYASDSLTVYTVAFLGLLACIAGVVLWTMARPPSVPEERLVLVTAGLLVLVPVLGPGFSPQYAWWWIAPLVIVFALYPGPLRPTIIVLYVVAAATYIIDYGLVGPLGHFLLLLPHPAALDTAGPLIATPQGETYLRLPLFVVYVTALVVMGYTFWRSANVTANVGRSAAAAPTFAVEAKS